MKKLLFTISTFTFLIAQSQTAQFAWIAGSTLANDPNVRGTKGVPSTTNVIGARYEASIWEGTSNTFYMFGGASSASHNDLWRYDMNLDEWVWLSGSSSNNQAGAYGTLGVASVTNNPGSRYGSASWSDSNGDLWLFGGYGYGQTTTSGQGNLQDLWKYTVADNKWMWVSGSKNVSAAGNNGVQGQAAATNTPSPRNNAITWVDNSGNLWMFGGYGMAPDMTQGYLSDLWKYDLTTSMWTWVSGNGTVMALGTYGTKGVAAALNKPSGRQSSVAWKDNSGNLWLFGGFGKSSVNTNGALNDLWKFNTTTSQWTWMTGSNTGGANTVSGIKGTPSATFTPGARENAVGWTDGNNFWLHGGTVGTNKNNELWMYNVTNGTWVWVDGSLTANQAGIYGTKNVFAPTNEIGSRQSASATKDFYGNFILFGGNGSASSGVGYLNDVWKIDPCYTNYASNLTSSASLSICPNQATTLTASGAGNLGWYTAASGGTYLGAGTTLSTPTLTANTTYYVQDSTCGAGPRTAITVTVNSAPTVVITGTNLACANRTVALNTGGSASTYTWSTLQTTTSIIVTPSVTTTYTVIGTAANSCTNSAVKTITVLPLPTLTVTGNNVVCSGNSTTLTVTGANTYTWSAGFFVPTISIAPSASTNYTVIGKDANNCTNMTTYSVTVNPLPTLTISTNSTALCIGESSVLNINGANTYTWNTGANTTQISITPSVSTTYSVFGTDGNNCVGMALLPITVNQLPVLNVSSTSSLLCVGQTATLSVSGASTYTWSDNSNGTNIIVTPTANTDYTVTGIDANNCSNSTVFSQSVSTCTGISENLSEFLIHIFPNPNNGEFTIQSQKADVVTIINDLGQTVQKIELNQQNDFSYRVNSLQNGIYFLMGETIKQKIVVTK
ncbi:MAG: hypothetical protein C0448_01795 [Sphingobacteriaceae bacterium]|nr:hypothetical protein [Sphingobacteriaceae bacterium]